MGRIVQFCGYRKREGERLIFLAVCKKHDFLKTFGGVPPNETVTTDNAK